MKIIGCALRRGPVGWLVLGGLTVLLVYPAGDGARWSRHPEYDAGVRDIRGGQMPAGSIPCGVLGEELRLAVEVRRAYGLHHERIRGQVHEKYRVVMRECGVSMPAIQEERLG